MKAATVKEIKDELKMRSSDELEQLCLRLSRFKKENKELLTYLLFESEDEEQYIRSVKQHIDSQLDQINTSSLYYIKKSARKILRETKKYIRYTSVKETEIELLLYYCRSLYEFHPSVGRNRTLMNLLKRQVALVVKKLPSLHEDLQYDYREELDRLPF